MKTTSEANADQAEKIETQTDSDATFESNNIVEKFFSLVEKTRLGAEDAKALYAFGYHQYQQARYREAAETFLYLVMYSPVDSKNLMALAACCQAESDFEKAIPLYQLCFVLTPADPYLHFYTAECLLRLGRKQEALQELKSTIALSQGAEQFSPLLNKASGMAELLEKSEAV